MPAAAAGVCTMTEPAPSLHGLRVAGRDGEPPVAGRADRVRRRWRAAVGGDLGPAQPRAAPDDTVRGRHHRSFHRARRVAALDQRAALHAARQHGTADHRRPAPAAARLRRCRFHGRGADRSVRQPQLVFYRGSQQSQDQAAGQRRRQRHLLIDRHDRGHEAREAPLRGEGRFHHLAGLA